MGERIKTARPGNRRPPTSQDEANSALIERTKPFRFQPGQSGNPSGRPKVPFDLKEKLKEAVPTILERMIEQAGSPETDSATVEVRKYLLNRLYGTPEVQSKMTVEQQGADFSAVISRLLLVGTVPLPGGEDSSPGGDEPAE